MTHEQRLTDTSTGKSDVQSLTRQTALSDLVEEVKVEVDPYFLTMIELITFCCIIKKVMTDVSVEGDTECISQDLRNSTYADAILLAVVDI